MTVIRDVLMEGTFGGYCPPLPIPEAELKAITDELKDTDPMFVTLPIGKVDVTSRNGRTYPRSAVESMVAAINANKPGGMKGHLRDQDRPYQFDTPSLVWLAARLEADGTAWAKAYVMPEAKDVRDYVRVAKITRAKVGTSLYGTGEMDDDGNVTRLDIETIDLVHPQRVGVETAAAVPVVTAESVADTSADAAANPSPIISETKGSSTMLTAPEEKVEQVQPPAPVVETELVRKHKAEIRAKDTRIAELEDQLADHKEVIEQLKAVPTLESVTDPVKAVQIVIQRLSAAEAECMRLLESAITGSVAEAVKMEAARPVVAAFVRDRKPTTQAQVQRYLAETLESPAVKTMLAAHVVTESGEAHNRPNPMQEAQQPKAPGHNAADDFEVPAY